MNMVRAGEARDGVTHRSAPGATKHEGHLRGLGVQPLEMTVTKRSTPLELT